MIISDLKFKNKYLQNKKHYVGSPNPVCIDIETVSKAIDMMSNNKAPGHDNLTIEYKICSFFTYSYFMQIV